MSRVLNKHKDPIPPNAVYIGRGSKWGNPYVLGRDGDREEVCQKYKEYILDQIYCGDMSAYDLAELAGKPLVCFCAPKQCHGDTLVELSDQALQAIEEHWRLRAESNGYER